MHDLAKKYSDELVSRTNELFFDLTSENYDKHHLGIWLETNRWLEIARLFLDTPKQIVVLDLGCGTGFVPRTVGRFLKEKDTFICNDVSENILKLAKKKIKQKKFKCKFKFLKTESNSRFKTPLSRGYVDIVTMNSVLHRFKDTKTFLAEINRVLKPGGLLIVAHEPNKHFYNHRWLRYNAKFWDLILNPRIFISYILRRIHLHRFARNIYRHIFPGKKIKELDYVDIASKISEILIKEALIEEPLRPEEISYITDIRSRTGFAPEKIVPKYKILWKETYNHLHKASVRNRDNWLVKKYDEFLRKKFPDEGSTFFAVYKKH